MRVKESFILAALSGLLVSGCAHVSANHTHQESMPDGLVGAWRGKVQFKTGALAALHDLEFMYVFNAGGTMTESSNYDGSPPVPPAYGVWKQTGPRQYEARYSFFITKAPGTFEEIAAGGGWTPAGRGVLVESITVSEDGKTFRSATRYDAFDPAGAPTETGTEAETQASRMFAEP